MQKTIMKNSKKGFSLPMAIATSLFLIIISTSLLFISIQSMSTTSVDISGRQAYLNVRSALEYARSYYATHVTDYSKVGTEYLVMNDPGGTVSQGAEVKKSFDPSASSNANYSTYVMAVYKKGTGSDKSTLTLTAFSKYSDAYGNKSKLARLSVTYTIGSQAPNRLTIIGGTPRSESVGGTDSITLNVKKPKSMDDKLYTYYIWTYKDSGNAYELYNENSYTSFNYDEKVIKPKGWVGRLNTSTMDTPNKVETNEKWETVGNTAAQIQKGPQGVFADTGNGWFMGEYFIQKGYVPWFNIIFAQQGSVLEGTGGASNIYDSQLNEIFHLWYLDPSDKNIYFEFAGDQKTEIGSRSEYFEKYGTKFYTKYYEKGSWDGRQGLDDTIVVYVKNPKTTIHFRIKDQDDTNTVTTLPSSLWPKIKSVTNKDGSSISGTSYIGTASGQKESSNISMQYEGCGWWVASVETNRTFDLTLQYSGSEHKAYAIDANSVSNEFWLVENDGLNVHMTEESALYDLGIDSESYVTVHAKIADYTKKATPKLIYNKGAITSTIERLDLLKELLNATQLVSSRYTATSYQKVKEAMDEGFKLIDNKNFIDEQDGPTDAEKILQADVEYKKAKKKLVKAVEALVNVETTMNDVRGLISLVNQGKYAEQEQANNGEFDSGAFSKFMGTAESPSNYTKAQAAVNDPKSVTLDEVAALEEGLQNDLTALRAARLDRGTLSAKIEELKSKENLTGVYEAEGQAAFNTAIQNARVALGQKETSQGALNDAYDALVAADNALVMISVLDVEKVNELLAQANAIISNAETSGKVNCTDDSYAALTAAIAAANTAKDKTKQDDVNKLADDLEAALNAYTILKPAQSLDELNSLGVIRLWVINNSKDTTLSYEVRKYSENSATATTVDMTGLTLWGSAKASEYRYLDIAKADCEKFVVATAKDGADIASTADIMTDTIGDANACVVINEDGTLSTVTKIVTVYGIFDGDEVKGKIGTDTIASSFDSPYYCFRYPITDANKNENFGVVNKYTPDVAGDPAPFDAYNAGKLEAGEYIIQYTKGVNTASVIKVSDIYPKYSAVPTAPEEPKAGPTLANDDIQIGDVIHTNGDYVYFTDNDDGYGLWKNGSNEFYAHFWNDSGYSTTWPGNKMDFYKQNASGQNMYMAKVPDNAKYVIFNCGGAQTVNITLQKGYGYYKTGWSDGKMTVGNWKEATVQSASDFGPYETGVIYITNNYNWDNLQIYFWGDGCNGAPFPGYYLDETGTKDANGKVIYKITPPKNATKFIVNNGNGSQQTVDTALTLGHHYEFSGGSGAAFQLKDLDAAAGGGGGGGGESGGGGTYNEGGYSESDLTGTDMQMAYVGGRKVRIQNKSYSTLYGSSKTSSFNSEISTSNPFGGSGINNESGGRLGLAELTAYYDWYEFKIPVSTQAEYSFTIEGMDPSKSTVQTKIVEHARGDVWLEMLSNYNGGSGHFQNYNILTFDPEESQIGDTLTVYFKLPYVDTVSNPTYKTWKEPNITVDGPFVDKYVYDTKMTDKLNRTANSNIYYKSNIPKNNPFITFTVIGPDIDDPTKEKTYEYKTCFQGGDYVLFDPSLNHNYGGWVEFVSDQERLKRAVNLLRTTYYGCKIASQYNNTGNVSDSAYYTYSTGLYNLYENYSTTVTQNGCTFFITKNFESSDDTWCYNEAISIENFLKSSRALYVTMNEAKAYISDPLKNDDMSDSYKIHGSGGGVYPEYNSRTVKNRKYTAASVQTLRSKLAKGEEAFLGTGGTTSLDNARNAIKSAISGLEIMSEGSIAMVLFDCQNKVADGSKFQIRFTLTESPTGYKYRDVTEYNPERYPIYFLSPDGESDYSTIYNVQFVETDKLGNVHELGQAKPSMNMNEAWVYIDQSSNGKWSANTASDYREINAEIFEQTKYDASYPNDAKKTDRQDYIMKVKKTEVVGGVLQKTYSPMTLLFTKDAEVKAVAGAPFASYVIKAGSYYFDDDAAHELSTEGVVNLYSSEARSFFTNENNIGYYISGEKDLNENTVGSVTNASTEWIVNNDFKTGANSLTTYVNFAAKEGSFTRFAPYYSYETSKGIHFRWESTSALYLSTTVKMIASEFKFANMGTLDGTKTRTPHFYLIPADSGSDKLYVEFRTDFYVKYIDKKGEKHQFAIREGKYEIRRPAGSTTAYIADLFDETYWKGMENITYIGRGTINEAGTGTTGDLIDGTYGN